MSKHKPAETAKAERAIANKKTAERKGRWAEAAARWRLRTMGYRIIEANFKVSVGEIDIIAMRGQILSFVEVKLRPTHQAALEAITPRQRQRIERAAEVFLGLRPDLSGLDVRFDVYTTTGAFDGKLTVDAWRPGW
ncbi:MAG: YraN family protein [Rhodospirillaceae bacterium]|nr:YraN family protein [Rhodospirillaceae bacterium]